MDRSVFWLALIAGAMPLENAASQTAGDAAPRAPSRTTAADVIVVTARSHKARGGGLIRPEVRAKSISTVSHEYIQTQAAVENAYQLVALTPGANVAMSDPYGLSQTSSINVHGLGPDEIGYVLEGMPLNDIGYYVGYPAQFIDSENIDEISLAQASADLDSPVISAGGGILNMTMLDPSVRPGGSVDAAYGSYHMNREFVRLDSGLIGDTGIRAFVSFSHTGDDNWRGSGRDKRTHIDFKIVREWGEDNRIAVTGTYNDAITSSYLLPTLGEFQTYGRQGPDNYPSTYSFANAGNYWKLYEGTFRLFYMSAPSRFTLADGLKFEVTPYWQYGFGNSPYGTQLSEAGAYQGTAGPYTVNIPHSVGGYGNVVADYTGLQYRAGVIPKLTYVWGPHSFVVGYWFDYGDEQDRQPFTGLSGAGDPGNMWADSDRGLIRLPNGQVLQAGADHVETQVNMVFVGDTISLLDDRLKLEAGFKEAVVRRDGTNLLPGPQYKAILNSAEPLPRLSARYRIDNENQVFANATTNFRTPSQATLFDAYYGGIAYAVPNTRLKTEYSISEEIGYRYSGPLLTGVIDFFNYNFTNRQISTVVGGNLIEESINAGGQTSRGVDVEAGTRPWNHVSAYVSGEYLDATIDNNLQVGTDYLPTAGKVAVRSPKLQGAVGLSYDDGRLFGNVAVKYVGSQYATFINDEKMPSFTTADAAIGYRLPQIGLAARPELRLNLLNIADANYLSGVATPTANANTAIGLHGTSIAGSSPTYYIGGGFAAVITLKQAF